jgi:hypothetical protein
MVSDASRSALVEQPLRLGTLQSALSWGLRIPNRTSVLARPTGFERADAINIRIPTEGADAMRRRRGRLIQIRRCTAAGSRSISAFDDLGLVGRPAARGSWTEPLTDIVSFVRNAWRAPETPYPCRDGGAGTCRAARAFPRPVAALRPVSVASCEAAIVPSFRGSRHRSAHGAQPGRVPRHPSTWTAAPVLRTSGTRGGRRA